MLRDQEIIKHDIRFQGCQIHHLSKDVFNVKVESTNKGVLHVFMSVKRPAGTRHGPVEVRQQPVRQTSSSII